jgi:hypothetical protein
MPAQFAGEESPPAAARHGVLQARGEADGIGAWLSRRNKGAAVAERPAPIRAPHPD